MNELDEYEQEVYENPNQPDAPFERDQYIAKRLLSVNKYGTRAISEDTPIANNNPLEMQATRSAARLINRLEHIQKMFNLDLSQLIDFFESDRAITEVTGRGKNMAVGYLTKSNINIQQAEQMIQNYQHEEGYGEEASQSIQEKISQKVKFLKKKEM